MEVIDFTGYLDFDIQELSDEDTEEFILNLLSYLDIDLSYDYKFHTEDIINTTYKRYIYSFDKIYEDDKLIDGDITVIFAGYEYYITNNVIECQFYDTCKIISEEEAYNNILEGKFKTEKIIIDDETEKIEILDVELNYMLDTNGYYQPVYEFNAIVNDTTSGIIVISALKN